MDLVYDFLPIYIANIGVKDRNVRYFGLDHRLIVTFDKNYLHYHQFYISTGQTIRLEVKNKKHNKS
jgi:hypothetical protein